MLAPLDPSTKDWIQAISWMVTSAGVAFAGINYVVGARHNQAQRAQQLAQNAVTHRWKQAEAGKKLLDEMLADEHASAALRMLDWNDDEYEVQPGRKERIAEAEYLRALRVVELTFDAKETYIRNCFDALFYYLALMAHYIRADLVRLEDVSFPMDYYIAAMDRNREVFDRFLAYYGLARSAAFLDLLRTRRSRELAVVGDSRALPAR